MQQVNIVLPALVLFTSVANCLLGLLFLTSKDPKDSGDARNYGLLLGGLVAFVLSLLEIVSILQF